MKQHRQISSYTPSNTDPEILERILVQREKLLSNLVQRLSRSMSTGDKHHILLIGPRGCGKTHFLTLAHFRLSQDTKLADSMRIAWLGEDTVFTGIIDLAVEMAKQLADEYPDEFAADFRSSVKSLPADDAAEAILKHIVKQLGTRNLLLMMENCDLAFHGLGEGGQKKWRAFLQETRKIATLATSQQLFDGVSKRDEVFFGFFDLHHLKPLSVSEAVELISKVAKEYDNMELVEFLKTNEGCYRVRALRHLAGGNHRMYILLSEFITKDSLDDLVYAFEQLAEELTPYFQERIRSLSPQQARIVQSLCDTSGAITVKALAEDTFIPERNCSKQLGELKKKCYVRSEKRGKESYYEMAEPLMRLCLELKNQRGRPLRLIAMFLRAWFPIETLYSSKDAGKSVSRSYQYCTSALKLDNGLNTQIQKELDQEIEEKLAHKQFDAARSLVEELSCVNPAYGLLKKAHICNCARQSATDLSEIEVKIADYTAVIEMDEAPVEPRALALVNRGITYGQQGEVDLEIADCTAVIEMDQAPIELRADALLYRSASYWQKKRFEESFDDQSALVGNKEIPEKIRQEVRFYLPESIIPIGSRLDAMNALTLAFEEGDPTLDHYGGTPHDLLKVVLLQGPSKWSEYISDIVKIFSKHGAEAKLSNGLTRAIEFLDIGDYSHTQLELWNEAWQDACQEIEAFEIALKSLSCAIEVIKTKSDRPLFELPLEIRELIIPLLKNTLES